MNTPVLSQFVCYEMQTWGGGKWRNDIGEWNCCDIDEHRTKMMPNHFGQDEFAGLEWRSYLCLLRSWLVQKQKTKAKMLDWCFFREGCRENNHVESQMAKWQTVDCTSKTWEPVRFDLFSDGCQPLICSNLDQKKKKRSKNPPDCIKKETKVQNYLQGQFTLND